MNNYYYAFISLMFLLGCSDSEVDCTDPDAVWSMSTDEIRGCQSKLPEPFEYISIQGYGENWESTEKNVYRLLIPEIGKKKFKIGTGACEKYLGGIERENVYLHVAATNTFIVEERDGRNDVPVKHVKLQCMAMKGVDQGCEEAKDLELRRLVESGRRPDARAMLGILFIDCHMREEVGPPRDL
jgi:hypothetical protein